MHWTKRTGMLVILIALTAIRSSGFAQYAGQTDCSILGNADPGLYAQSVERQLEENSDYTMVIYTNDDMGVALTHLKQFCCNKKLLAEEACSSVQRAEPYYPQSPYIFDHLMYVGMKKMDGIQDDCDVLGIDCQPREYDIDPVERRDEITEIAHDTKGYPPGMILDKFTDYRGDEEGYMNQSGPNMLKAYGRLCHEATKIRYAVNNPQSATFNGLLNMDSLELSCATLVARRYAQESSYVRTLQIEKGTKFLVDNLRTYLNDYFINKRMADLIAKFGELDGCTSMIARYADKTAQCNQ